MEVKHTHTVELKVQYLLEGRFDILERGLSLVKDKRFDSMCLKIDKDNETRIEFTFYEKSV